MSFLATMRLAMMLQCFDDVLHNTLLCIVTAYTSVIMIVYSWSLLMSLSSSFTCQEHKHIT